MQNTKRNVINNENIEIQAVSELKIEMIWYENVTQDAAALLNFSPAFPQNKTTVSPSKPQGAGVGQQPHTLCFPGSPMGCPTCRRCVGAAVAMAIVTNQGGLK